MEVDGLDPNREEPTYSWLRDHGFRPLLYALREYHDRTFVEFWREDFKVESVKSSYDWATDHNAPSGHSGHSSRHAESGRSSQTHRSTPFATD